MLTRLTAWCCTSLGVLALNSALAQQAPAVLLEQEPNESPELSTQTLKPGEPFAGVLGTSGAVSDDTDTVWVEFAEPTRVDLDYAPQDGARASGAIEIDAPGRKKLSLSLARGPVFYSGLTLPAGRYPLRLIGKRVLGLPYRLSVTLAPEQADAEHEPNDPPHQADTLTVGEPRRGWISHTQRDKDQFRVEVTEEGLHELLVHLPDLPAEEGKPTPPVARWALQLGKRGELASFSYTLDEVPGTRASPDAPRVFRFFPVLPKGTHELTLSAIRGVVRSPYTLELRKLKPVTPDPKLLKAGRRALDRGLSCLIELDSKADRSANKLAAQACVLLALGEGSGAAGLAQARAEKIEQILDALEKRLHEMPKLLWRGRPVKRFDTSNLYEQSMITLALAECALAGNKRAKALCVEGVRLLLAAQISPERSEAYTPMPEDSPNCGGWRYTASSKIGDLSVSGWCLIAIFAADVAGVEVPGLQRGVARALRYVTACSRPTGFAYDTRGKPSSVIQQGIGALLDLLFDTRSPGLTRALAYLDVHQCAGTQSGWGKDTPFYYWYYATRANFLRGGSAWRTWRTLTLRQLVERQREDGSWDPLRDEARAGKRYSTGLAIVILRLCLGEAPGYLSQELEAF